MATQAVGATTAPEVGIVPAQEVRATLVGDPLLRSQVGNQLLRSQVRVPPGQAARGKSRGTQVGVSRLTQVGVRVLTLVGCPRKVRAALVGPRS